MLSGGVSHAMKLEPECLPKTVAETSLGALPGVAVAGLRASVVLGTKGNGYMFKVAAVLCYCCCCGRWRGVTTTVHSMHPKQHHITRHDVDRGPLAFLSASGNAPCPFSPSRSLPLRSAAKRKRVTTRMSREGPRLISKRAC